MAAHHWDERAIDILRTVYPAAGPRAVAMALGRLLGWTPSVSSVRDVASRNGVHRARGDQVAARLSKSSWEAPEDGERWRVCGACGELTPENSRFCRACGKKLGD